MPPAIPIVVLKVVGCKMTVAAGLPICDGVPLVSKTKLSAVSVIVPVLSNCDAVPNVNVPGIAVNEMLPAAELTLPLFANVMSPQLVIVTLPPPLCATPVIVKGVETLSNVMSPLVVLVPLKLFITLLLLNVVPVAE